MTNPTATNNYFDTLVGKVIKGHYRIDRKIGEGGMGAVFQATDTNDNSQVAIKIISPMLAANQKFLKRFRREAKVGTVLSHVNIIKVHEYGETEDNLLYMSMEFAPGETMRGYLTNHAPLSVERTYELFKPLCEAIEAAHNRNLLHRDLKPENVILTKDAEGKEVLKLADFGLVKLTTPDGEITKGSNLTEVGEVFGTPIFMSPEQIMGQIAAAPADIYSVGTILYQMLTGKLPIEPVGNDLRKLLVAKVSEDVPPPSKKFSFVNPAFDTVIANVLARDPKDRYQTAGELLKAFEKAMAEAQSFSSQSTNVSPQVNTSEIKQAAAAAIAANTGKQPVAPAQHNPPAKPETQTPATKSNIMPIAIGAVALLAIIVVLILLLK